MIPAKAARLMKVIDVIVAELDRQGVAEMLADVGFDPAPLAQAVIKAADGEVIYLPHPPRPMTIERGCSLGHGLTSWNDFATVQLVGCVVDNTTTTFSIVPRPPGRPFPPAGPVR